MDFMALISDLGFPIAGNIATGYFIFLTLKFILSNVTNSVTGISKIITSLNARVATMNNDVQKIDGKISHLLGLIPEFERMSRAEQLDHRKD